MNLRLIAFVVVLLNSSNFIKSAEVSVATEVSRICNEVRGVDKLLEGWNINKKDIFEICISEFGDLSFISFKINANNEIRSYCIDFKEQDGSKIATKINLVLISSKK